MQLCEAYPAVENGVVSPDSKVEVGRYVTVTCDKGFALSPEVNTPTPSHPHTLTPLHPHTPTPSHPHTLTSSTRNCKT